MMIFSITTLGITISQLNAEHCYAECPLCSESFLLSVIYAQCHIQALYAECRDAECRYSECRYADCRYAVCLFAECRYAVCVVLLNVIMLCVSFC